MTDGSIGVYNKKHGGFTAQVAGNFGSEVDAQAFEADVRSLGFPSVAVKKSTRTFQVQQREQTHTTYTVCHNGAFATLMTCLGITTGLYTEKARKPVPDWIMKGSPLVKREFLSAFQGGDGCKIRWNRLSRGYNYVCAATMQQIHPDHAASLQHFMGQMVTLLREFGVEVQQIEPIPISETRVQYGYKIKDSAKNLIHTFQTIGYTYDLTKKMESALTVEFLRTKEIRVASYKGTVDAIRDCIDRGGSHIDMPDVKPDLFASIKRSYELGREIGSPKGAAGEGPEAWSKSVKMQGQTLHSNPGDSTPCECSYFRYHS